MATRSIGKFLPTLNLRLGTKAVICAIFLIAVNTALVVGAAYWSLTSEFGDRALRDIEVNLRTLALTFSETYPDAKIPLKDGVVARAEVPRMPDFKDHAIVDRAVGYVGGNATLFVYDEASNQFVRRSTNVKKENGDRAVGTQLAPDHPGQPIVRRVTKPLTSVTASLTAIAEGNSDVEIDCHERNDEIGEIARTVAVFKNNSIERRKLCEEQAAATTASIEQRKAELRGFVDEFQTSVGGILDKVLNSSGEFERFARQLTETARTTAGLSG